VQVCAIRNRVADVDSNPKANGSVGGLVTIMIRNLLLYLHGTAHRSVDAVENDEQRVARVWTILPPYSSIAGSIRSLRRVRRRLRVSASSSPINRL
jgi:hypothetical protein